MVKYRRSNSNTSLQDPIPIEILHFNLLPGGICRDPALKSDPLNRRFSETVLESIKVALVGLVLQGNSICSDDAVAEGSRICRLVDTIDASKRSANIIAGGMFPHLIARRSEA